MEQKPEFLVSGEVARLIPIVAESSKEKRSASVLLAGLRSVYELRQALLRSLGVRVGTRAKLSAWTEPTFASTNKKEKIPPKDRPDGLIELQTGKKVWRAVIEAKVGNATVGEDQMLRYIQHAKQHKIDAVITITNQFAALPTHHPVSIPKSKKRNIEIFHWSWSFIRTQCAILLKNEDVEDEDQVFILEEILRYFDSDSSGISQFDRMNPEWKDVVSKVKHGTALTKTADEVQNTVTAWHQEQRDLCLIMSRQTASDVSLRLKPNHRTDPEKRVKDDADELCKTQQLRCNLVVQNAAADIEVVADLHARIIECSMKLAAPKDKKSTTARTNWLLRQIKGIQPEGFWIRATRPGKAETTKCRLSEVFEDTSTIESNTSDSTVTTLEVVYHVDLGGKFGGNQVFIQALEAAVPHFYREAGQRLKAWTPPPPKIKAAKPESAEPDVTSAEGLE